MAKIPEKKTEALPSKEGSKKLLTEKPESKVSKIREGFKKRKHLTY